MSLSEPPARRRRRHPQLQPELPATPQATLQRQTLLSRAKSGRSSSRRGRPTSSDWPGRVLLLRQEVRKERFLKVRDSWRVPSRGEQCGLVSESGSAMVNHQQGCTAALHSYSTKKGAFTVSSGRALSSEREPWLESPQDCR